MRHSIHRQGDPTATGSGHSEPALADPDEDSVGDELVEVAVKLAAGGGGLDEDA